MLTEERFAHILQQLKQKKAVTVTELAQELQVSESTIRRDLSSLDGLGKLTKVHGGATLSANKYLTHEEDVAIRKDHHHGEKQTIGRYAASQIDKDDFVYIDAGTTTFQMIDFLEDNNVAYVTNGLPHAKKLAARGFRTYLLGGRVKASTEAVIGTEAIKNLSVYNFTKGFFGTNGISSRSGFTTPECSEGNIKIEAFTHCRHCYILADNSKFKRIYPITFGQLEDATIITNKLTDKKYKKLTTVIEVGDQL